VTLVAAILGGYGGRATRYALRIDQRLPRRVVAVGLVLTAYFFVTTHR